MAIHDFRSQRLFVDEDLTADTPITATREQANYLLNVLRLATGGKILIFNGRHGEWLSAIEAEGRKKCTLIPLAQTRPQPTPATLTYCFAPLKQARLDYMIQKAVEMGVGSLQPVITQRTQVRSVNEKRLRANAIEAAEQCGILSLPTLHDGVPLAKALGQMEPERLVVFCDEGTPQSDVLSELAEVGARPITLLIGPEGGFSDEERDLISSRDNILRLGLGPRILRADTAAVAALSIIQAHAGDWYEKSEAV